MLNGEDIFQMLRAGQFSEVHELFDRALPTATSVERSLVAHWRPIMLRKEGRHQEALDHIHAYRDDMDPPAETLFRLKLAEVLNLMSRSKEALEHLQSAPIAADMQKYGSGIGEAKFFLLYLKAINGKAIQPSEIDEIPDSYIHLIPPSKFMSKQDLQHLIDMRS